MLATSSVVICSRERPRMLLDAVNSVLAMRRLPSELVVVDQSDGPQGDLAAGIAAPVTVRYLWSPGRGVSRARNEGVSAATGEIVAFLDDDMLVEPDWLDCLVRALTERGRRYVICGQVRSGESEVPGGWAPSTVTDTTPRSYSGRLATDVLFTGNMALFRSTFAEVGQFDERLGPGTSRPAAEDNDFCYRLLLAGFVVEYRPEVVAIHRAWRHENTVAALKFDYGRGQGAFYVKHIARGDWFMARRFAGDVFRHVARAARRWGHAKPQEARRDLAYARGLVLGAGDWFRSP